MSVVVERYKLIGGKSPLPELVKVQAEALQKELGNGFRAYEGFRYSRPAITESFKKAVNDGATRIIGFSLSPFETIVTTGAYRSAFEQPGDGTIKKTFIPSWHDNPVFIDAWVEKVKAGLERFPKSQREKTVVVFTSHSIPLRYIAAGDPYQMQVEETVRFIVGRLNLKHWRIAWQSKGARTTEPWIGPEVETTLDKIAQDGYKAVLEVPVGFTCDHMETLYDIDIELKQYAASRGLQLERIAMLNDSSALIDTLASVLRAHESSHCSIS